jgi:hypothetical protein
MSSWYKKASKSLKDQILELFKNKENISNEDIINWAKKEGYSELEVENTVCEILSNFLSVGKAKEEDIRKKDVSKKELKDGKKVEMEHVKDEQLAEKIALDHLAEIPDYYNRLKKMEEQAKNSKKEACSIGNLKKCNCGK